MLSRLPLEDQVIDPDENYVFNMLVDQLPVTAKKVAECTSKDPILARVYDYTASGWPNKCTEQYLLPYWSRNTELSLEDGCILWGNRVIVPNKLQKQVLEELHEGHPGMNRMKALARSFVWWPGLDEDIMDVVRMCDRCASVQNKPKEVPMLLWP